MYRIATDKILHFLVGYTIAFTVMEWLSWIVAIVAVVVVGLAKELYDIKRTGFDEIDLLFTIIGGFMPIIIKIL